MIRRGSQQVSLLRARPRNPLSAEAKIVFDPNPKIEFEEIEGTATGFDLVAYPSTGPPVEADEIPASVLSTWRAWIALSFRSLIQSVLRKVEEPHPSTDHTSSFTSPLTRQAFAFRVGQSYVTGRSRIENGNLGL
jgi:hypothetical protein